MLLVCRLDDSKFFENALIAEKMLILCVNKKLLQKVISIADALIEYHNKECITMSGNETLNSACRQNDPGRPDYIELFVGTKYFTLIQCALP